MSSLYQHSLVERDGRIFVLCVMSDSDIHPGETEPKLVFRFYPTGAKASTFRANAGPVEGIQVEEERDGGRYRLTDPEHPMWRGQIQLEHGGKTECEFLQLAPYPCPKVRKGTETRYYIGRWQKYAKRERAWVDL